MPSLTNKHRAAHVRARRHEARPSARVRGYDSRWQKLRDWFIGAHPLCLHCERKGRTRPATEVDHIRAFAGVGDPLRLDPENLQSLCRSCHARKTRAEQKEGGGEKTTGPGP